MYNTTYNTITGIYIQKRINYKNGKYFVFVLLIT